MYMSSETEVMIRQSLVFVILVHVIVILFFYLVRVSYISYLRTQNIIILYRKNILGYLWPGKG